MKPLEQIKILVVGDIMLDKYVVGDVERISPEAPVPVVHVKEEYYTLGGCGNVVRNLVEMGVNTSCLSAIGIDADGVLVEGELKKLGVNSLVIRGGTDQTIVKERFIASERKIQMLRVDRETIGEVSPNLSIAVFNEMTRNDYDMVIVSDYGKGMITKDLMDHLKTRQDADIIVDPKPIHGYMYNDVFMITPNEKEWSIMQTSSRYLLKDVKYILETKGKEGMVLMDHNQAWEIPAEPVEVYNVSGAGDTVVAAMATCLSIGLNPVESAKVANKCAGFVVTQPGTTIVPRDKFQNMIECITGK